MTAANVLWYLCHWGLLAPMADALRIREMTVSDYVACKPLWEQAGMHHELDFESRLTLLLQQTPGICLVAQRNEMVVGCILGSYNEFSGYLFRLVVLPDLRGAGIGKALFLECERRLQTVGAAKIMIACEPELETFYQKLGYEKGTAGFMMKIFHS